MMTSDAFPADLKVFLNHVYEFKKGVRNMVLYTTNRKNESFAVARLASQHIAYCVQPVDSRRINLFFGRPECINAIRFMATRPLNELTPGIHVFLFSIYPTDIREVGCPHGGCACRKACAVFFVWNGYGIFRSRNHFEPRIVESSLPAVHL